MISTNASTESKGKSTDYNNMDPVTAIFNAIGGFFQFASTPAGQQILADIRNMNQTLNADIAKLVATMAAHAPAPK